MKKAIHPSHVAFLVLALVLPAARADAASPSVEQALKLAPVQRRVDFSRPTPAETPKCKITVQKTDRGVGWVVENPDGLTLRTFTDTNRDNVVDRWCYYKDGLEVYRDIDSDFNGKADQYRWFHTGGCRWGLDKDEDGQIDAWKVISAEEVTAEVIAALADRDADRFTCLLMTPRELKATGLGPVKTTSIEKRLDAATSGFARLAARQRTVGSGTKWIQFSATSPGTIPAGTEGSTKDLQVYENAMALIETGGEHDQVQIGTLVKVGNAWRVTGLPQAIVEGQADTASPGFFFQTSMVPETTPARVGPSDDSQRLLDELEKLDRASEKTTAPAKLAKLNANRADLVEKIAENSATGADRDLWFRQLADMITAAAQSGGYPDGAKRLETLFEKLKDRKDQRDLAAYVRFRQLTAEYGLAWQSPKPDHAKIQGDWLKNLEAYVDDYPTSPDAAEAMLQLANDKEFADEEDDAKKWYQRIVRAFPKSAAAKKASGALARLGSVGSVIKFRATGLKGSPIDLTQYRGRVVLLQYWASWCKPAVRDMELLKNLVKQHPKEFAVIGVSLDNDRQTLDTFLAKNRLPWAQVFEPGGLDSRPANQLGILTLPTMILIDRSGKVVNRNVQSEEIEDELEKLIR